MLSFYTTLILLAVPQIIQADLVSDIQNSGLTTLLQFVGDAGLVDTLASVEPFTLFAPTNEAFAKLPKEVVASLTSNPDALKDVLLLHVIPNAAIKAGDLAKDQKVAAANGKPIRVNKYTKGRYTKVLANGQKVIKADVSVGNKGSVVHVIDDVLPYLPEDNIAEALTKDGRFGTLLAAVGAAGLGEALSNPEGTFTVFAPTDDAFQKIPPATLNGLLQPSAKTDLTNLLLKHVLPEVLYAKAICWDYLPTLNENERLKTQVYHGGLVIVKSKANYARVVDADIQASNGVIHAIDTVI